MSEFVTVRTKYRKEKGWIVLIFQIGRGKADLSSDTMTEHNCVSSVNREPRCKVSNRCVFCLKGRRGGGKSRRAEQGAREQKGGNAGCGKVGTSRCLFLNFTTAHSEQRER
ncbi:hypothetical protein D052_0347 [Vibrio parahaemolyticus 10290]|nr:hypothetical protein D052_0347 [Vibrio parahaemolyticus 10290]